MFFVLCLKIGRYGDIHSEQSWADVYYTPFLLSNRLRRARSRVCGRVRTHDRTGYSHIPRNDAGRQKQILSALLPV